MLNSLLNHYEFHKVTILICMSRREKLEAACMICAASLPLDFLIREEVLDTSPCTWTIFRESGNKYDCTKTVLGMLSYSESNWGTWFQCWP